MSISPPSGDRPCGILCLDKPKGITSRAAIDRVVRVLGRNVKVGHAGTLDPLATGLLVVCVGPATRLIEYVQRQTKRYRAGVLLGVTSGTLDADGEVKAVEGAADPGLEKVRTVVAAQTGSVLQRPPDFSALKLGGKRAYDLARAGQAVHLEPRPVRIDSAEILRYDWPRLDLEIVCGGGTYIRSIARDVGEALGCGGIVESLARTRIGHFCVEDALTLEELSGQTVARRLRPAAEAVPDLTPVRLTSEQVAEILQGRSLTVRDAMDGEVALMGPEGFLVAVGEARQGEGKIHPRRVLSGAG